MSNPFNCSIPRLGCSGNCVTSARRTDSATWAIDSIVANVSFTTEVTKKCIELTENRLCLLYTSSGLASTPNELRMNYINICLIFRAIIISSSISVKSSPATNNSFQVDWISQLRLTGDATDWSLGFMQAKHIIPHYWAIIFSFQVTGPCCSSIRRKR